MIGVSYEILFSFKIEPTEIADTGIQLTAKPPKINISENLLIFAGEINEEYR